ncbi:MAG: alpha/beta hydrolase [Candidatus Puniceispirillaceae bacterium]
MTTSFLDIDDGTRLAYQKLNGNGIGIVFLAGHGSDMLGSKAEALYDYCAKSSRPFLRFDYSGHGLSSGAFLDGTITGWTNQALAMIDHLTEGPQILVGSSLGGWIMLNVARQRPQRIMGCVGIAAAPDFTETLIWNMLDEEQQKQMQQTGQIALPNPYAEDDVIYPYHLIEDGRRNLLLEKELAITCPIILHQGMADHEVPWQTALAIAEQVASDDVTINLVKSAGHRFSSDAEIAAILSSVTDLTAKIEAGA